MKFQIVYTVNGKIYRDIKEYNTESEAKQVANIACLKCISFPYYRVMYYIDYIEGGNNE
jgi:hypothetical protein